MRPLFTIALVLLCIAAYGQSYYIPYASKGKVGLVNEKGVQKIPGTYDNIDWAGGAFFKAVRQVVYNDTLRFGDVSHTRNNIEGHQYSLIYKGKEIIRNSPYRNMEIIGQQLIIAQVHDPASDINQDMLNRFPLRSWPVTTLFNAKGQVIDSTLYEEVQVLDTIGKSQRSKGNPRYALLKMRERNKPYALLLFDLDQERVSLVCNQNIRDVQLLQRDRKKDELVFSVTDVRDKQERYLLRWDQGGARLTPFKPSTDAGKPTNTSADYPAPQLPGDNSSGAAHTNTSEAPEPALRMIQDTIFYFPNRNSYENRKVHYTFRPGQRLVFNSDFNYFIYEDQNKYGIITLSGAQAARYDMLWGFAGHIIAQLNGKTGIMDTAEKFLLPLQYDSLAFDMDRMIQYDGLRIRPYKEERLFFRSKLDYIIAYQGGKVGLFSNDYKPILPLTYDYIVRNNAYAREQYGKESKYLAKQAKSYYAFQALQPGMPEPQQGFDYIPLYRIDNYYGIKDFTVYALYDESGKFRGYVSASGKKFYE